MHDLESAPSLPRTLSQGSSLQVIAAVMLLAMASPAFAQAATRA